MKSAKRRLAQTFAEQFAQVEKLSRKELQELHGGITKDSKTAYIRTDTGWFNTDNDVGSPDVNSDNYR